MKSHTWPLVLALGLPLVAGCDQTGAVNAADVSGAAASRDPTGSPCDALAGNARDICEKEAEGQRRIDSAVDVAAREPSEQHTFAVSMARARAAADVARERCDDLTGNPEDVCRAEADRQYQETEADATLRMNLAGAAAAADRARAEADAQETGSEAEALEESVQVKQQAAINVAREKCDRYASAERSDCIENAEMMYSKP